MSDKNYELDLAIACIRMGVIKVLSDKPDKKSVDPQLIMTEVETELGNLKDKLDDKYGQGWTDKQIESNTKEIAEYYKKLKEEDDDANV